ncbi:hypothetical protein FA95DRAFT_1546454 [Auriscalpium vulgare]|uniref:Uncharacterized protein n=1 Tax=Auriscalpium vulgare TaxID=40419 RepID=A0ACB8RI80_9AGAM|nr:hypothetical protein FA95DRAFT_1546454 [Auriscalpium vulgare]
MSTPRGTPAPVDSGMFHPDFEIYDAAEDIPYTPEAALRIGKQMIGGIGSVTAKLMNTGPPKRRRIWRNTIEQFLHATLPNIVIAIIGATGAGKSTLVNSILGAQIVPTSGLSACTSAVTKVMYHDSPNIEAEVKFIPEEQWRHEIQDLIDEVRDKDPGRRISLPDNHITWAKVRAVYPNLHLPDLRNMEVDDVLATFPGAHKLLGTTRTIRAPNADEFAWQVGRYIDSKRRAKRPPTASPVKKSAKGASSGVLDLQKVRQRLQQRRSSQAAGKSAAVKAESEPTLSRPAIEEEDGDGMFYPLVDGVEIRCNARALSTGAVLMDLPGLMDADAARSAVARRRLGEADHIFIVAPIKRAVDDHLAKTLLSNQVKKQIKRYSGHGITFIATHTDDASPSDLIEALRLHDDPVCQDIESRLMDARVNIEELKAEEEVCRDERDSYEPIIQAIKNELAARRSNMNEVKPDNDSCVDGGNSQGRIDGNVELDMEPATKKRKLSRDDEDYFESSRPESADDADDTGFNGLSECELEATLSEHVDEHSAAVQTLSDVETQLREELERSSAVQMEMNAYVSHKRSEWAKRELKADFKLGIAQSEGLQDYEGGAGQAESANELPVFCCSSRDYLRLQGLLPGDGPATCFSDPAGTEIPALQEWCIHLTLPTRLKAAARYHARLNAFVTTVAEHVAIANSTVNPGYGALKLYWQTTNDEDDPDADGEIDESEEPQGLSGNLVWRFDRIVSAEIGNIQGAIEKTLANVCKSSADTAAAAAPNFVEEVTSGMWWNTFRATLRRHGSWRTDINEGLADPLTDGIADVWADTFRGELFADVYPKIEAAAKQVILEMEARADLVVRADVRKYGWRAVGNLLASVRDAVEGAEKALGDAQRQISRTIVPFIQKGLTEGYENALAEGRLGGKGVSARERAKFQEFVNATCAALFNKCSTMILRDLDNAVNFIQLDLTGRLRDLASNVEVEMSTLWYGVTEGKSQIRARAATTTAADVIMQQLPLWEEAHKQTVRAQAETAESVPGEG